MVKIKKGKENLANESRVENPVEIRISENNEAARNIIEGKENFSETEIKELRNKIEVMDLDDKLKQQAQSQAKDIKPLGEEKKLKRLLIIAQKKGIIYAVNVAKNMKDPYILDRLHDTLAKEGYYKKFLK